MAAMKEGVIEVQEWCFVRALYLPSVPMRVQTPAEESKFCTYPFFPPYERCSDCQPLARASEHLIGCERSHVFWVKIHTVSFSRPVHLQ